VTTDLLAGADERIAAVEALLREELRSTVPLLNDVCDYVFGAGGKRLRPGLVLLSGGMFGADEGCLLPAAAAVEMIHTATLLHDDIMDASPMRRGRLTVPRRWSDGVAVYAGDYILSRAFTLLSGYGRPDVLDVFAEVTRRLCRGEALQSRHRRNLDVAIADYLEVIDCKTAHFLSCCCRVGGMLGEATPASCSALAAYGEQLGIVFQVTDDLLDYVGDTEETGKDVGADFREGKYTLPVIMALQGGGPAGAALRQALAASDHSEAAFRRVRALVLESGSTDEARSFADECTTAAIATLESLPDCRERDALREIAVWVEHRKR
jgi:octaprenyl-diphosphate synthase